MTLQRPIRRSQLISTWGVGAIIPFPDNESLMIAGLDAWYDNAGNIKEFKITDSRLEKRLGVDELRCPPDFHNSQTGSLNVLLKIPAVRFPRWHYCPHCGFMIKTSYYSQQPKCEQPQWPHGRSCIGPYPQKMIPERFIVICPNGHIDDFPIAEWVHHGYTHHYDPNICKIRRSTGGKSAALTGVFYECTCGAKQSLVGATTRGALAKIGYKCHGSKPWLGIEEDTEHLCGGSEDVKVVQRGGTNVWFADIKSSIYIPVEASRAGQHIQKVSNDCFLIVTNSRTDGKIDRKLCDAFAMKGKIDPDLFYQAIIAKSKGEDAYKEISEDISEEEFRIAEYNVLDKSSGNDKSEFHSVKYDIALFDPKIKKYFSGISLVPKLKETRALAGFSRLIPDESKSISEKKKELRLGDENWLPAVQVFGEGIFFNFNQALLAEWAAKSCVLQRISILDKSYKKIKGNKSSLNPKYVLIHTFAHLLINQLSFNCGYGSSSIRERIYCDKDKDIHNMNGVLLYTASGDSDGSLGGLVRQGQPRYIEPIIVSAIRSAGWCSSDPVCIQSLGQGAENSNLAACHNCALLPETCCENGNKLLDRGLLIGTLDDKNIGYFSELLNY
jgi:hypothetical protein